MSDLLDEAKEYFLDEVPSPEKQIISEGKFDKFFKKEKDPENDEEEKNEINGERIMKKSAASLKKVFKGEWSKLQAKVLKEFSKILTQEGKKKKASNIDMEFAFSRVGDDWHRINKDVNKLINESFDPNRQLGI